MSTEGTALRLNDNRKKTVESFVPGISCWQLSRELGIPTVIQRKGPGLHQRKCLLDLPASALASGLGFSEPGDAGKEDSLIPLPAPPSRLPLCLDSTFCSFLLSSPPSLHLSPFPSNFQSISYDLCVLLPTHPHPRPCLWTPRTLMSLSHPGLVSLKHRNILDSGGDCAGEAVSTSCTARGLSFLVRPPM